MNKLYRLITKQSYIYQWWFRLLVLVSGDGGILCGQRKNEKNLEGSRFLISTGRQC